MKDRTRKALENLLGQVVQARDGFGIYQQSKSMDAAVKEAAAALASQPSGPKETSVEHPTAAEKEGWQYTSADLANPVGEEGSATVKDSGQEANSSLPMEYVQKYGIASSVASDLRAKLESLRELQSEIEATGDAAADAFISIGAWKVREWAKRLTAIIEGKD